MVAGGKKELLWKDHFAASPTDLRPLRLLLAADKQGVERSSLSSAQRVSLGTDLRLRITVIKSPGLGAGAFGTFRNAREVIFIES
jgi:hypothetical protein